MESRAAGGVTLMRVRSEILRVMDGEEADIVCHLRNELDVVRARHMVTRLLNACGVTKLDSTRLLTAVSEVCVNAVQYAGCGVMCAWRPSSSQGAAFVVKVADEGPGIADLEWAFTEHNSTGGSLGLGLPGARRLVDDMQVISPLPGRPAGTLVTLRMNWRPS